MYLPAAFREDSLETQFELIRHFPLGLIMTAGPGGLMANWVPFLAYPQEGTAGVLRAHVARANAQWRELQGVSECLVAFRGPQAYISPTWYATKAETHKVVPTWNYATVQIRGRPTVIEDAAWLGRQIGDLTLAQEGGRPKPWSVAEAPGEFVAAQIRAIVGVEIAITRMEGKWKMSQNRVEADRRGAVEGLRAEGTEEAAAVAEEVARRLQS